MHRLVVLGLDVRSLNAGLLYTTQTLSLLLVRLLFLFCYYQPLAYWDVVRVSVCLFSVRRF